MTSEKSRPLEPPRCAVCGSVKVYTGTGAWGGEWVCPKHPKDTPQMMPDPTPTNETACDHSVWCDEEKGVQTSPDLEPIGECGDGCCDDYRCLICGKEFRVEWPQ